MNNRIITAGDRDFLGLPFTTYSCQIVPQYYDELMYNFGSSERFVRFTKD